MSTCCAVVPDQLQEANETTLSIDECSVNGDSKKEIENLKRKFRQNKQEMDNLEKHLSVIFTDDQLACLTKGFGKGLVSIIYLPSEVVKEQNLVTNAVSIAHIQDILLEEQNELKLCPQLTASCLDIGHYDKIKVEPAHVLINNSVAVALRYYVNLKKLDESALATAWFIETAARWFAIVTSRTYSVPLSLIKKNYDEMVALLESVIWPFSNLKIGIRGVWKPVEAGIVLTTTSMLALQEMYLKDHKFKFILLSRFSQDAIENLFSSIRLKNPVPNCKEFKTCLRLIILSQYFTSGVKGNSFSDADVKKWVHPYFNSTLK
ncbi:hypothetical protein AVEN_230292-1 [Araneus ventricosus]|uniref:Transposable element P transposase-like GTP-binding insertion domain-containing protein n=1 Tax=Araneus ventricosus TaxID=182803 RepID=A0A4Y2SG91_ARAVE|nr:hypothetical protein AVEN_230292-1 [Araneus ventricosus]